MLTCNDCGQAVYENDFCDDEGNPLCEDCYEKMLEEGESER